MFKSYNKEILGILDTKDPETNWKQVLENHHIMQARIRHERLIHLLVTFFVGMVVVLLSLTIIVVKDITLLLLDIPLLALFTGYLFHYRFLENTTQSWYILEDKIKDNLF